MAKTIKMNDKKWELPTFKVFEFRKKKTKYCVCIPVLNEGEKFKKQIRKMKKYSSLADIIIADWGSTDGSTDKKFLKEQGVKTLLTKVSFGKQGTQYRMGFAYALREGYAGIITLDGNNKDGVEAIPDFIKALDEGWDYIQGSRFIKGGKGVNTPLARTLAINLLHAPLISLAAHKRYTDTTNNFRGYSKKYLLDPRVSPFRKIFVGYELLFYLGVRAGQLKLRTKEIPVTRSYPKGEVPTKISGFKSYSRFLNVTFKTITSFYHPK